MVLFGLGVVPVVWLVLVWNTTPPPWPVLTADFIAVVGLLVGPWLVLVGRRFVTASEVAEAGQLNEELIKKRRRE